MASGCEQLSQGAPTCGQQLLLLYGLWADVPIATSSQETNSKFNHSWNLFHPISPSAKEASPFILGGLFNLLSRYSSDCWLVFCMSPHRPAVSMVVWFPNLEYCPMVGLSSVFPLWDFIEVSDVKLIQTTGEMIPIRNRLFFNHVMWSDSARNRNPIKNRIKHSGGTKQSGELPPFPPAETWGNVIWCSSHTTKE